MLHTYTVAQLSQIRQTLLALQPRMGLENPPDLVDYANHRIPEETKNWGLPPSLKTAFVLAKDDPELGPQPSVLLTPHHPDRRADLLIAQWSVQSRRLELQKAGPPDQLPLVIARIGARGDDFSPDNLLESLFFYTRALSTENPASVQVDLKRFSRLKREFQRRYAPSDFDGVRVIKTVWESSRATGRKGRGVHGGIQRFFVAPEDGALVQAALEAGVMYLLGSMSSDPSGPERVAAAMPAQVA